MQVGDVFEGRVRGVSSEGLGVAEAPDKRVFFAPATWIGDRARFRITELKRRHGLAEVVEMIEASPARVEAPCAHHGWGERSCGGCPWQFVAYESQLAAKEDRVREALRRARIDAEVSPIIASPKVFGYRNRAQLKTDGRELGFVAVGSRRLAPIEDCVILNDKNRAHLRALRAELPNPEWKPQVPHPWNFIDIDEDFRREDLVLNKRRAFRQGNSDQNAAMRAWLASQVAAVPASWKVLELFAGSGNFTEVLAERGFAAIAATEVVDVALEALRAKQLAGVSCFAADLFQNKAYPFLKRAFPDADLLVLDPPRDGLKEKEGLLKAYPNLKAIASISCDLATFTRDLGDFLAAGFRVREIRPLDQFPHTPHIEIMAWLERA
jgi:23S rRNA (uracil1939-C5)-methyltransferase